MKNIIGKQVRFFSERVFGVWVSARIIKVSPEYIILDCCFWGNSWKEKAPYNKIFFSAENGE